MKTARRLMTSVVLMAAAGALVPAAPALAARANPELVASRHITSIETLVDRTHTQMVTICQRTVATVELQDDRNVAEARIQSTGNRGLTQIDSVGAKIETSVDRSTAKILTTLQRMNAEPALIEQVNAALAQAKADLAAAEVETKTPIQNALTTALAD